MPKRSRKPNQKDVNQLAASILAAVTQEAKEQPAAAAVARKQVGLGVRELRSRRGCARVPRLATATRLSGALAGRRFKGPGYKFKF